MREKQRLLTLLDRHRNGIDRLYAELRNGQVIDLDIAFAGIVEHLIEAQEIIDRIEDKYN